METSLNKLVEFMWITQKSSPLISTHYGISYPQKGHRVVTIDTDFVVFDVIQNKFDRKCSRYSAPHFKCANTKIHGRPTQWYIVLATRRCNWPNFQYMKSGLFFIDDKTFTMAALKNF